MVVLVILYYIKSEGMITEGQTTKPPIRYSAASSS